MGEALWPAPVATRPVEAVVRVPGSKSQTNRALVLAALADGPSLLRAPLRARDTLLMATALRTLGAEVVDRDGDWAVRPPSRFGSGAVDCGLAGTVMRFVPPLAALAEGDVRFDGDPRARERPMAPIVAALRALGVSVSDDGRDGLPFTVHGRGRVRGGSVTVDASGSSQFVSALLLAGYRYDGGLEVRTAGAVPSLPHVEMTVRMLSDAGLTVRQPRPGVWQVPPGIPRAGELAVEPDLSNAAPFLAAAVVTGGRVAIADWPRRTAQPGSVLPDLLGAFGARWERDDSGLTVAAGAGIHGTDLDLHEVGELVPVLATVAALADSPTTIRGVAHLRGHETDRLAALATQLRALGGDVTETADGLRIRPSRLHGGAFATYDDHRLATAAAVIGLRVPGVLVENVGTTAKTLPDFTGLWSGMLG
jgi:3-phosphoshikimate 1-carboxyvinyltransferase